MMCGRGWRWTMASGTRRLATPKRSHGLRLSFRARLCGSFSGSRNVLRPRRLRRRAKSFTTRRLLLVSACRGGFRGSFARPRRRQLRRFPLWRVIRFDFHPTTEGWRISEANADVPGGFAEASEFPRLIAELARGTAAPSHSGDELAGAIRDGLGGSGHVALLSAPGYTEDLQVTVYLADRLRRLGIEPHLPSQIRYGGNRSELGLLPTDATSRSTASSASTKANGLRNAQDIPAGRTISSLD